MDMIAFGGRPGDTWEIHVGFAQSSAVESASATLAILVRDAALAAASDHPPPEIYRTISGSADPADGRSDHSSFHAVGYSACCISERFFIRPGSEEEAPDRNPNYHSATDRVATVNPEFAASIARALAAATWVMANKAPINTATWGEAMTTSREIDPRQQQNLTGTGLGNDAVRARAHSGPVVAPQT
jgi:leucyl aminopeptidase